MLHVPFAMNLVAGDTQEIFPRHFKLSFALTLSLRKKVRAQEIIWREIECLAGVCTRYDVFAQEFSISAFWLRVAKDLYLFSRERERERLTSLLRPNDVQ